MPLTKYRQKRDFTKSPEPAGTGEHPRPRKGERFFCVQKHLASHLHYDFRLEHDGVLLSWAVPKGPSLNPADKRLAMHVEDHPIEYGEFEGVIPSGYGAGIVMLWDRGTWQPEVEDIDAALKKGDLKFQLDGIKLKGSWVLVRTGGRYGSPDQRSWLLIKHRDDWSGDLDITEFAPRSVKSDGDFPDILAADNPDVWVSQRPAAGGASGAMLAKIIEQAAALKAGRGTPEAGGRERAAGGRKQDARGRKQEAGGRRKQDAEGSRQAARRTGAPARVSAAKPRTAAKTAGRKTR